ncbi:hypothetical protein [Stackebrandtia soli]|uniref:hypothetical protein n=1 Tax=Stackebrandtia soli TaxID=1892856 RepID=UPI0039E9C7DC
MDSVADPLLIDCPDCNGNGAVLHDCPCAAIENSTDLDDCPHCLGTGDLSGDCLSCDGGGRSRAQLVLTMINLDLSTIASATIIPGVLAAVDAPPNRRGAELALDIEPTLHELADRVGGIWCKELEPTQAARARPIPLDCSSDDPISVRLATEARALARHGANRHWIFTAHTQPPENPPPDVALARLCRLADLLCLDLIVQYQPWLGPDRAPILRRWDLRLALPGQPLPHGHILPDAQDDPAALIGMADPGTLLARLHPLGQRADPDTTPAHRIRPRGAAVTDEAIGTVDALVERVRNAIEVDGGGAGVWRDGAWHISGVRRNGETTVVRPRSRGRLAEQEILLWALTDPPPDPSYWGEPIPGQDCPTCESGTPWAVCPCRDADGQSDPGCRHCGGGGSRPVAHCHTCEETGRLHHGASITITDLDGKAEHLHWTVDADASFTPYESAELPDGYCGYRLDQHYRITELLRRRDIDGADVSHVPYGLTATSLFDGRFVGPCGMDARELTLGFVTAATRGQPGGRSFLVVTPRRYHSLSGLAQICFGLGYELYVSLCDTRGASRTSPLAPPGAQHWNVDITPPHRQSGSRDTAARLDTAIATAKRLLIERAGEQPHSATMGLPAPQQPVPATTDLDTLEPLLTELGGRYDEPPRLIVARLAPGSVRITHHSGKDDDGEILADADSVASARALL